MRKKLVFALLFLLSLGLLLAVLYLSGVLKWGGQKLFNQKNHFSAFTKPQAAPDAVVVDEAEKPALFSNVPEGFAERFNQVKCELPEGIKETLDVARIVPGIKEGATGGDDYWILIGNRPVVLDYFRLEANEYLVGGLQDKNGNCFKLSFILTGSFGIEDKSGMFDESKIRLDETRVSADEFKIQFPIGSQVLLYTLARRPERFYLTKPEFCGFKGTQSEYYCSIQRATETYSRSFIDLSYLDNLASFPADREPLYVVSVLSDR